MKIRYLLLSGGLLLLISFFLNHSAYESRNIHNWIPLREPISLKVGTVTTKEFVTDIDDWFEINLEVERKIEPKRLYCLLGVEKKDCTDIKSVVAIDWSIISNNIIIQQGQSNPIQGAYWSSVVGRVIGRFKAEAGQTYRLKLAILQDGHELEPTHPQIKVAVHPHRSKNSIVKSQLLATGALILVVLGTFIFVGSFGVWLYRKIKSN